MDKRLNSLRVMLGLGVIVIILLSSCVYMIPQGEAVVSMRLGRTAQSTVQAGIHFRLPWPLEKIERIDIRKRNVRSKHTEMLTRDNRNIIVLSFVLWSVEDPLLFYQAVGSHEEGDEKIDGLLTNAKISIMGGYDLSALASVESNEQKYDEIENKLRVLIEEVSKTRYGIRIHDVGISRLSLPKENIQAVFKQMRAERKQYAAAFKAEGAKRADEIRAQTDVDVAKIKAKATAEAAQIRGDAEALAADIYANAYKKDPDLYRFIRELDTLEKVLGTRSSVILRTDAQPFRLLQESK